MNTYQENRTVTAQPADKKIVTTEEEKPTVKEKVKEKVHRVGEKVGLVKPETKKIKSVEVYNDDGTKKVEHEVKSHPEHVGIGRPETDKHKTTEVTDAYGNKEYEVKHGKEHTKIGDRDYEDKVRGHQDAVTGHKYDEVSHHEKGLGGRHEVAGVHSNEPGAIGGVGHDTYGTPGFNAPLHERGTAGVGHDTHTVHPGVLEQPSYTEATTLHNRDHYDPVVGQHKTKEQEYGTKVHKDKAHKVHKDKDHNKIHKDKDHKIHKDKVGHKHEVGFGQPGYNVNDTGVGVKGLGDNYDKQHDVGHKEKHEVKVERGVGHNENYDKHHDVGVGHTGEYDKHHDVGVGHTGAYDKHHDLGSDYDKHHDGGVKHKEKHEIKVEHGVGYNENYDKHREHEVGHTGEYDKHREHGVGHTGEYDKHREHGVGHPGEHDKHHGEHDKHHGEHDKHHDIGVGHHTGECDKHHHDVGVGHHSDVGVGHTAGYDVGKQANGGLHDTNFAHHNERSENFGVQNIEPIVKELKIKEEVKRDGTRVVTTTETLSPGANINMDVLHDDFSKNAIHQAPGYQNVPGQIGSQNIPGQYPAAGLGNKQLDEGGYRAGDAKVHPA